MLVSAWTAPKSGGIGDVLTLIGVRSTKHYGLNCGASGYQTCEEFKRVEKILGQDFKGPTCLFKAIDLGIAFGSAVKTANILNVNNRIMYCIGVAVERLNILPDASIIMGIPLLRKELLASRKQERG